MITESYPNETLRVLMERASCRAFQDRKIEPEVLEKVLAAGMQAPTGGNLQPYSIIKVEDEAKRARISELCGGQPFIAKAPIDLIFCIDMHRLERWADLEAAPFTARFAFRHFWIALQDTMCCAQNLCTAADGMGLGSVYVGSVLECFRELIDMLRLPRGVFPVVLLSLGYPVKYPNHTPRLPAPAVVHDEFYHDPSDEELLAAFHDKYGEYRLEATTERVEELARVCGVVGGQELAERCLERVRQQGFISNVQRRFGLHYQADTMPEGNPDFLRVIFDQGFSWMNEYKPQTK